MKSLNIYLPIHIKILINVVRPLAEIVLWDEQLLPGSQCSCCFILPQRIRELILVKCIICFLLYAQLQILCIWAALIVLVPLTWTLSTVFLAFFADTSVPEALTCWYALAEVATSSHPVIIAILYRLFSWLKDSLLISGKWIKELRTFSRLIHTPKDLWLMDIQFIQIFHLIFSNDCAN